MGQQQLLLIVLGVIIVGIAVVVGINLFTANSQQANRDNIIADLIAAGSMAHQYYRKPVALGGGGNTFTGWTMPVQFSPTVVMSAPVTVTVAAQSITFVAVGNETGNDGSTKVKVTMVLGPNGITSTTINN